MFGPDLPRRDPLLRSRRGIDGAAGRVRLGPGRCDLRVRHRLLRHGGLDPELDDLRGADRADRHAAHAGDASRRSTDQRVRRAIQLCCDAAAYPELVYQGRATAGEHHHVSPVHPEYFALPPMKPDIEQAKKLLAEAGHAGRARDQHRLRQHQRAVAAAGLRDPAGPAGAGRDQAQHQPHAGRRSTGTIWDQTPFGITAWTHRPLGTMVLSVGYRTRRALERERLRQQGVRRRRWTRPRRWSTSSSAGRPWRRWRRSSRTRR